MSVWIFVVRINRFYISRIGPRAMGAGSGHVPENGRISQPQRGTI